MICVGILCPPYLAPHDKEMPSILPDSGIFNVFTETVVEQRQVYSQQMYDLDQMVHLNITDTNTTITDYRQGTEITLNSSGSCFRRNLR